MLLIHTCCADCSLKLWQSLQDSQLAIVPEQIAFYYYAPNIHPRSEFLTRLTALKKLIKEEKITGQLIVADYQPQEYFTNLAWQDCELIPNKKIRCPKCWQLRLDKTFQYAKEHGFQQVSTTMLTSSYMDTQLIAQFGQQLAKKYQLEFIIPQSICCQLNTRGFYKQNYCGCCFSLLEKIADKFR